MSRLRTSFCVRFQSVYLFVTILPDFVPICQLSLSVSEMLTILFQLSLFRFCSVTFVGLFCRLSIARLHGFSLRHLIMSITISRTHVGFRMSPVF